MDRSTRGFRNRHQHICESLELFSRDVLPAFKAEKAEREAAKAAELAPYIEAALARKQYMPDLADEDIPIIGAAVARPQVPGKLA